MKTLVAKFPTLLVRCSGRIGIVAEIKPTNIGSIKAFQRAGFALSRQTDDLLTFELARS